MELKEFNEQMARLNDTNNNYYTKERKKHVWSIVSEVDAWFFEKRVSKAMWTDHPPKLDFFQKIRSDFEKYKENQNLLSPRNPESDLSKFSYDEIISKLTQLKKKL